MHDDEVEVTEDLVRRLLAAQMPDLADRSLAIVEPWGTDNAIWRLGNDLVVRLPRIYWAQGQVDKEATWLPILAPRLPIARPDERSVSPATSSTPTLLPPSGKKHSPPPLTTAPGCGSTATSKATASSGPDVCAESSTGGPRAEVTQQSTYRSCGHPCSPTAHAELSSTLSTSTMQRSTAHEVQQSTRHALRCPTT